MVRRDHTKLSFFQKADELVLDVYKKTEAMEPSPVATVGRGGRWGDADLRSSMRYQTRAVAHTIVEACRGERRGDFQESLECAVDQATDAQYMVSIAGRLGQFADYEATIEKFDALIRDLSEETTKT